MCRGIPLEEAVVYSYNLYPLAIIGRERSELLFIVIR